MSEEQKMQSELKKVTANPEQELTFQIDNPEELSDEELEAAAGGVEGSVCGFRSRLRIRGRVCGFRSRIYNANDEV